MKPLIVLYILFISLFARAQFISNNNCKPESADGSFIYSNDFKWNYALEELKDKFKEIYHSEKRLKERAYFNQQTKKITLPGMPNWGGDIVVTSGFVQNIAYHISEALKYEYIDGVFFPDMGHSHLLIPNQLWEKKYKHYPINKNNQFYMDIFQEPELLILYHTAEQLETLKNNNEIISDRATQWRYHTRNLIGKNSLNSGVKIVQNKNSPANTLNELEGYYFYGSGFNISANYSACFEYKNGEKSYRFDLSLFDIQPKE